jgi:hypothetical protein
MSIASSASEDGWVPTVYDSVEKVKGTAENKRTVCCVVPVRPPFDTSLRSCAAAGLTSDPTSAPAGSSTMPRRARSS